MTSKKEAEVMKNVTDMMGSIIDAIISSCICEILLTKVDGTGDQ